MVRIAVVVMLLGAWSSLNAQLIYRADYSEYQMGDSLITFVIENNQSTKKVLFINVHENERTSVDAFNRFDVSDEYRLIWLKHNASRRIGYNHRNEVFTIDPNRIFSQAGIEATLANDSIFNNRKAEKMAHALAKEIINYITASSWIISLHNNTPDNYSILSYLLDSTEAPNTKEVFINSNMDADDFIYTTDVDLFNKLKEKSINVILQDNENCIDDGSLSVYCGKRNIPYVNVEAEHGHLHEQLYLIRAVVEVIE